MTGRLLRLVIHTNDIGESSASSFCFISSDTATLPQLCLLVKNARSTSLLHTHTQACLHHNILSFMQRIMVPTAVTVYADLCPYNMTNTSTHTHTQPRCLWMMCCWHFPWCADIFAAVIRPPWQPSMYRKHRATFRNLLSLKQTRCTLGKSASASPGVRQRNRFTCFFFLLLLTCNFAKRHFYSTQCSTQWETEMWHDAFFTL